MMSGVSRRSSADVFRAAIILAIYWLVLEKSVIILISHKFGRHILLLPTYSYTVKPRRMFTPKPFVLRRSSSTPPAYPGLPSPEITDSGHKDVVQ